MARIIITMDIDDEYAVRGHSMGVTEEGYSAITDALSDLGTDIDVRKGADASSVKLFPITTDEHRRLCLRAFENLPSGTAVTMDDVDAILTWCLPEYDRLRGRVSTATATKRKD